MASRTSEFAESRKQCLQNYTTKSGATSRYEQVQIKSFRLMRRAITSIRRGRIPAFLSPKEKDSGLEKIIQDLKGFYDKHSPQFNLLERLIKTRSSDRRKFRSFNNSFRAELFKHEPSRDFYELLIELIHSPPLRKNWNQTMGLNCRCESEHSPACLKRRDYLRRTLTEETFRELGFSYANGPFTYSVRGFFA